MRSIYVADLGPHSSTAVTFWTGTTVVSGPSESGKSTLLAAVCLALWGRTPDGRPAPTEQIREGAAHAEVTVDLGDATVTRRLTASRRHTRTIVRDSRPTSPASEAEFAALLPEAYRDHEVARLVMVPMAWVGLLSGPGGGRPLREVLDRALPGHTADDLLDIELPAEAPRTEAAAVAYRRDRRKDADRAAGALAELGRQLDALHEPEPVTLEDVDAARAEVAAWDAARVTHERWRAARDRRAAWRAPERPSSERPEQSADTLRALLDATRKAASAWREREASAIEEHVAAIAASNAAQDRLEAMSTPEPCPGVAASACQVAARAVAEREALAASIPDLRERARTAGAQRASIASMREGAEADVGRLDAALADADAWARYDEAVAALGEEPPDPGPEPVVPPEPHAALGVLRDAERAEWAAQSYAEQRARLEAQVAQARERAAAADEAVDAAEAWLEAVRTAPGRALAGKLQSLGSGPLAVHLTDDGGIVATIDGRPWWLASRGRCIVADAEWRLRLRAACGLGALPVWVDDVSAVAGQAVPEGPGVVHLVTAPGMLAATYRDVQADRGPE